MEGLANYFGYQHYVTYGLVPSLFLYVLYLNNFRLRSFKNIYIIIFLLVVSWSFLLISISSKQALAFKNVVLLFGVFMVMLLTAEIIKYGHKKYIKWLLLCYVIAFYVTTIYMYQMTGDIVNIHSNFIKRSAYGINANQYSYFSYFALISLFYLIEITKKRIYIGLAIITIFWAGYISFITVSRSGILFIVLTSVIYWIFIFPSGKKYKVFKMALGFLLIGCVSYALYSTYNRSFLQDRVEEGIANNGGPRAQLAKRAVNVFLEHPITGVGPGQFMFYSKMNLFSHNSFTEIAANSGIFGLILIVLIFFRPFTRSIRRLLLSNKFKQSSLTKLNVLFFGTFILYNIFYAFYETLYGMLFFMIIVYIQKIYITKINTNIIKQPSTSFPPKD